MLEQQKLIERVKTKAMHDGRIACVLMYGSFTQHEGDEFSDVEFYIFVHDNSFNAVDRQEWISSIHPLYAHFFNEHNTEVVIFKNLVRGEFHFLPLSQLSIVEGFYITGYFPDLQSMNLCDKNGMLQQALQNMAQKQVDYQRSAGSIIDNLLNLILMGTNLHQRGELARSLETLGQAHRYYLQLLRLTNNSLNHWINPSKRLESEISPADYGRFQGCTASLHKAALARAWQNLLKVAQPKAALLAGRCDLEHRGELIEKLQARAGRLSG